LGGTEGEERLALEMIDEWNRQGLDHVSRVTYDVLLSYPNKTIPSLIYILNGTGDVIFTTQLIEEIVREDQNHPDVVPPFNAYSPAGTPVVGLQLILYKKYMVP